LTQAEVDGGDFGPVANASSSGARVDASSLRFPTERWRELADLLTVSANGSLIIDGWDFTNASFGAACSFVKAKIRACRFDGATFGDSCSFQQATFNHARFPDGRFGEDVDFSDVEFGAKATFHSAVFGSRARFNHSRFDSVQFFSADFGARTSFRSATFSGKAKFARIRLGDRSHFTEAVFSKSVDFSGASFGEKIQMIGIEFLDDANFIGAEFGPRARLTHWQVARTLNMRSVRFLGAMSLQRASVGSDAIFRYGQFEGPVDLSRVIVGHRASFRGARFSGADRLGPFRVRSAVLFHDALVEHGCVIDVETRVVSFSRARMMSPIRLVVRGADVILNDVEVAARLVISAPRGEVSSGNARLVSLEGTDVGHVVISEVDIRALRLSRADNIDRLRIEGGGRLQPVPTGLRVRRDAVADEHLWRSAAAGDSGWYPEQCRPRVRFPSQATDSVELARIYRGLRKAREDAKDAPGASDLYFAEMEMRRHAAQRALADWPGLPSWVSRLADTVLLWSYRVLGGYGVRPARPIVWFAVLTILAAILLDHWNAVEYLLPVDGGQGVVTVTAPANTSGPDPIVPTYVPATLGQILVFVIKSGLLLPAPTNLRLTLDAEILQVIARVVGPLLLGLFALGLRARVQR
jgi:uncharacterized protein YjbI with pentapeptide repeats